MFHASLNRMTRHLTSSSIRDSFVFVGAAELELELELPIIVLDGLV